MEHVLHPKHFKRTDIWREGEWVDLWSVVHFLSGVSLGFGFYFINFGALASVALVFVLLVAYEMWEAMVKIEETPANRFMDVVIGMAGFLPTYFLVAPNLSGTQFISVFGGVLVANILMSFIGWRASQKAAEFKKHMIARYAAERARLKQQRSQLKEKFWHDMK